MISTTPSKFPQVYLHCVPSAKLSKHDKLDYLHFLAKFLTYKFEKEVCKRPETLNVKRNLEGSHRMCSVKEFTGKQLCQSLKACYFIKQEALAQVFLWILRIFKEQLFYRTPPDGCFSESHIFFRLLIK